MKLIKRSLAVIAVMGLSVLSGCTSLVRTGEVSGNFHPPSSANELVAHLNRNSQPIQAVECNNVAITVTQDGQPFGVDGKLAFQKGRNFRMVARSVAGTEADLGSNDREFWFYMKRNNPPDLFYCSYDDLPRSQSKLPIQPDWIAEALCVMELNPNEYQIRTVGKAVELVKHITSPQGEQLTKTIAVATSGPNAGNVVVHRLLRMDGKEIWRADISEYHGKRDVGDYVLPRKVKISCPEQKVVIDMKLDGCKVNQLPNAAGELFAKPTGYRMRDIAQAQFQSVPGSSVSR
jgi:hypothetical protein